MNPTKMCLKINIQFNLLVIVSSIIFINNILIADDRVNIQIDQNIKTIGQLVKIISQNTPVLFLADKTLLEQPININGRNCDDLEECLSRWLKNYNKIFSYDNYGALVKVKLLALKTNITIQDNDDQKENKNIIIPSPEQDLDSIVSDNKFQNPDTPSIEEEIEIINIDQNEIEEIHLIPEQIETFDEIPTSVNVIDVDITKLNE